ncbi:MAG: hypothetical protein ACTSXT_13585 [Candidatus Helarchaeota archaeon]
MQKNKYTSRMLLDEIIVNLRNLKENLRKENLRKENLKDTICVLKDIIQMIIDHIEFTEGKKYGGFK